MFRPLAIILIAASLTAVAVAQNATPTETKDTTQEGVTRATLANGLRVVVVRDQLAPVVTVEQNYLPLSSSVRRKIGSTARSLSRSAYR